VEPILINRVLLATITAFEGIKVRDGITNNLTKFTGLKINDNRGK